MRRPLLIGLVILIAIGAGVGYYLGGRWTGGPRRVTGVIGSEKASFFADARVRAVFGRHRLDVRVDPRGSREMATTVPLGRYDFAFPGSEPMAERIAAAREVRGRYRPFASPLAVATFTPIVDLLAAAGVARRDPAGHWVLDLSRLLDLAHRDVRWDQLPGNVTYPARRDVLLTTSHPADSNSAAMYAWLAAQRLGEDTATLDRVTRLFTDQGGLERSSADPFERYLTQGLDYAPLVLGYEAQYVEAALAGTLPAAATLAYLSPTVLNTHAVLAFGPLGDEVGRLLATDPELARLAAEHGFRPADESVVAPVLARVPAGGAALPRRLTDVAAPPEQAAVQPLLAALDQRLTP